MGWFSRRREAPDANEQLRQYNEAEAARLAGLGRGASAQDGAPVVNAGVVASAGAEFSVEDVFTITGRGIVATGTVTTGTVRVGDAVRILRAGAQVAASEVTGVELFRKRATEAAAGSTAGLLLKGRPDVVRGDLLRLAP
ncbi:EF-Tu/IF-2/RF-3 family GTPase [Microbacterium tumbae]